MRRPIPLLLVVVAALGVGAAAQNRIDVVAPLAPELASYGTHDIGVRTLQVTDKNRPDILNTKEGSDAPPAPDGGAAAPAPAAPGTGQAPPK